MANAGHNGDLVLKHADGVSNVVPITLWRDSSRIAGGYSSQLVSIDPPRQSEGQANYAQVSPEIGLIWDQPSWHRTFGIAKTRLGEPDQFRYGYSDGVLAIFPDRLVMGWKQDEVDIIVRNGRFETGDTTGWSGTNTTIASTSESDDVNSGQSALKVTVDSNSGTVNQTYGGTVSVLQSRSITLAAAVRRISGSGTALARITDSAGSTDSSTSSSDAFDVLEVTRTIDASATSLTFTFEFSTSGDVWAIDDVVVVPAGGVSFPVGGGRVMSNEFYIPCGRMIIKWDEDDEAFYPVYFDANYTITSLEEFDGDFIAGRGTNDNYLVSADGTVGSWNDPTSPTGNASQAEFLTRARNATGDLALVKSRGNSISMAVDPSDTANWGAEIEIEGDGHVINNLFSSADKLYVGKEDGLFGYDGNINLFRDLEPEANLFADDRNYKRAIGRGGQIIAATGNQSLWRITDLGDGRTAWEELTTLFKAHEFPGFGGDVEAITQDRTNIWVCLADTEGLGFPYTFPFDFSDSTASAARLIAIRKPPESDTAPEDLVAHTVSSLSMGQAQQMARFYDGSLSSLFVFGVFTNADISAGDEPRIYRLVIPPDRENPALSKTPSVRLEGSFYTQWHDFFYPDVEKAVVRVTINSKNLSSTRYVELSYKTDDANPEDDSGWTLFGTGNGRFTTSPSETLTATLTSPVTFKRIRFRLRFVTDSFDEVIQVTSITAHAVWNPVDYRQWNFQTRLVDKRAERTNRGVLSSAVAAQHLSDLETLRQEPFCLLEDVDGTQYRVKIRQLGKDYIEARARGTESTSPEKVYVLTVSLIEVRTT